MENKYKNFDWQSVQLNFGNWEEEKVWGLHLPTEKINIEELLWHFDVPYWENDEGERWTVSPRDVIHKEIGTSREYKRSVDADTSYPIDVFYANERLYVLDGLHRLVKLYLGGAQEILVHKVPKERFGEIKSEYPIELP